MTASSMVLDKRLCFTWNPSSPFSLLFASSSDSFEIKYSEVGVGRESPTETKTVIDLIDVRESFKASSNLSVKELSKDYLESLKVCLEKMQKEKASNLIFFKSMCSIVDLVRIFILNSKSSFVSGCVTADLVKYLRHYYISVAPLNENIDLSWLESAQPENNSAFWRLIEYYCRVGYTVLAWRLLQKHSRFQHCQDSEDEEGFMDMCILLNCGAIPGGKCYSEEIEEESFSYPLPFNSKSWLLWEKESNVYKANEYFLSWSNMAKQCLYHGLRGRLDKRIPKLRSILEILAGEDVNSNKKNWADVLLYELIYINPCILPKDVSARAKAAMSVTKDDTCPELRIMSGDSGLAVKLLSELGGKNGAALPSTILALIFELLVIAKCVPPSIGDENIELLPFFLLKAGSSCVAANNNSVGYRCACRLLKLIPDTSTQVSYLCDFISHMYPCNDSDANMLIQFATIETHYTNENQIMLLEVARSIAIVRANHYLNQCQIGGAVHWYLRAIHIVSNESPSIADVKLIALLLNCSKSLLQSNKGKFIEYAQEIQKAIHDSNQLISPQTFPLTNSAIDLHKHVLVIAQNTDEFIIANAILTCVQNNILGMPTAPQDLLLHFLKLACNLLQQQEEKFSDDSPVRLEKAIFDAQGINILMTNLAMIEFQHPQNFDYMKRMLAKGLMRAFSVAKHISKKKDTFSKKNEAITILSCGPSPSFCSDLDVNQCSTRLLNPNVEFLDKEDLI